MWNRVALARELIEPGRVRRALARRQDGVDVAGARGDLEARSIWAVAREDAAGPVLFGRGARLSPRPHIAIVGARASDPYGLAVARRVALDVVALGAVVVSGGAEGCDAAAHEAVLDAGGITVAVFGGGHDNPYPACHRSLFERIAMGGGTLLSPYWPEVRPRAHRFIHRNRVIAALSDAVVVVRAGIRSGSLSTARAARELDVAVFAVPGGVGQDLSRGTHRLLVDGARPLVGAAALRKFLGSNRPLDGWPIDMAGASAPWSEAASQPFHLELDPVSEAVLGVLRQNPGLDLDGLVMRTECPVDSVVSALLDLELSGLIGRLAGERYAATSCGEAGPTGPSAERTGL